MSEDLRNDPNWRRKAPYGLHVDGTPFTKEEYEALHGKPKEIHVSVDTTTIENLAKERERVQEKEQELNEKLEKVEGTEQVFEQLKSAVEQKYGNEGLAVPKIENLDDLNNASSNLSELKRRTKSSGGLASGGSAPLNNAQLGQSENQGFGSYEEMITNLRDRASHLNPDKNDQKQADLILKKLMEKALKGQEEAHKPFNYEMSKEQSLSDLLTEKYRRRKALGRGS